MTDPYTTLGLQRNASEDEAKLAFRKLAKTCHPDLHPNDPAAEKRFKEINEAYDRICKGDTQEQVHFNTNSFNFGEMFGGAYHPFETIFGEINRRNQDMHLECRLTMEEAFNGKELNINVPNGRGATKNIKASIPQGAMHGMRVAVPRGGMQHNPGSAAGDLYINVRIVPHDRFVREGNDLVTMVHVTAFDVMLGKDITVTNIEGVALSVNIPAGFASTSKLRLAGQGMHDPRYPGNSSRGDLLIDLFVVYPELNDAQKELIKQASELNTKV